MGLFSSSYKYYAYAGSSYLLPAEDREHTVKSLMLQASITGLSSMAEAIKMGLQTDMYRRAMKMAKYAADPDGYPYGFPTTNITRLNLSVDLLRPYVEADAGGPVDFRTLHWGKFSDTDRELFFIEAMINLNYTNDSYFDWRMPVGQPDDPNWSPVDDSIEVPVRVNQEPPAKDRWAISQNQWTLQRNGNLYTVAFPYEDEEWSNSQKEYVPISGVYTIEQPFDMSPYNNDSIWIQVRYRMTGEDDEYRYWYYEVGSGNNPELEDLIVETTFEAEYLPIAILLHDRNWFDEIGNVPLEEGLDRLLKYIVMDPWDVKEDFIDSIENPDPETPPDQVPEMEDIWDFFVHFSMPLRTSDRAGREYLWRFYQYMKAQTWTTFEDYNSWVAAPFGEQPQSNFSVEEGEEYTGYIARYAWSYISDVTFDGEYTPPGWDRPLKTRECWSQEYKLGDPDYNVGLDLVHGAGNYNVATSQPEGQEHTYTVVVRQNKLSESVDGATKTYTAVLMMGPSMEYQINTSETPVGTGDGGYVDYRYRFVDVEIFPEDPEEDSEFRWPINIGVLKDMSAMRREPMLQEALAATVFLVDRVKVKWYQKGFFKWLIIIIVIIVIILTYQYQLLGTVSTLASTAFAAGATATAIAYAALYVAMTFALGFLISFAGSLIGGTWGQVFAIVAMLYLAGGANIFSNIGNTWRAMAGNFGWGTATSFLQSIGPVISVGRVIIENRALAHLESEMRDFTKTAREKYEQLEDAWDEFGEAPSWLDPLDLTAAFSAAWYAEDAESFLRRTLNANPGLMAYDYVNNFYDIVLGLPQEQQFGMIDAMIADMERQRGAA